MTPTAPNSIHPSPDRLKWEVVAMQGNVGHLTPGHSLQRPGTGWHRGQTDTLHQNGLSGTDPGNHIPACRKPNQLFIVGLNQSQLSFQIIQTPRPNGHL